MLEKPVSSTDYSANSLSREEVKPQAVLQDSALRHRDIVEQVHAGCGGFRGDIAQSHQGKATAAVGRKKLVVEKRMLNVHEQSLR